MKRQSKIIENHPIHYTLSQTQTACSFSFFLSNLGINAKRGSDIYQLYFFKNIFDKGSSIKNIAKFLQACLIYLLQTEEVRIKYKYSCSCIFVSFFSKFVVYTTGFRLLFLAFS